MKYFIPLFMLGLVMLSPTHLIRHRVRLTDTEVQKIMNQKPAPGTMSASA